MKLYDYSEAKNTLLKIQRNIGFEEVIVAIAEGKLLDVIFHPNKKKYKNQKVFIVEIAHYAYLVPFVENEKAIFLKTIIPSRQATKKYLAKAERGFI